MNSTAKRFGNAAGERVSAAAWSDSSQGSATVTPAPRKTARRDSVILLPFVNTSVQELRASDNGLDQGIETVIRGGEPCLHRLYESLVGLHGRAAELVSKQFARDVIYVIVISMLLDVSEHAVESRSLK